MALDFPNSPTNGQVYQNAGLTFIWDSATSKWRAITGPVTKKALCVATRNTNSETLSINTNYAILGSFTYNYQNLFTNGAGAIVVPYTGVYRVNLNVYDTNVVASGGRLGITVNNAASQSMFVQFPNTNPGGLTLATTNLLTLNVGDSLLYRVETSGVQVFSAPQHTQVLIEYMGDA